MQAAEIINGEVVAVYEINVANLHEFPQFVPTGDIEVAIGDTYDNGVFYRNGEEVLPVNKQLENALKALTKAGVMV